MKKVTGITVTIIILFTGFWGLIRLNNQNTSNTQSPTSIPIQKVETVSDSVRLPAVAGSFYPKDQIQLEEETTSFLSKSAKLSITGKPRILIVPHAGISYSGKVAASGFKQLEAMDNLRVIILGASHNSRFDYAAVDNNSYWQTPLGRVDVDTEYGGTLVNGTFIRTDKVVHEKEHSLEVELLFLQKVLKNFKIVPILLGQTSEGLQGALAQKLAYNFDENTVLVVSSDLSHYPGWNTANTSDNFLINSITTGKVDSFTKALSEINAKNYPNLITAACGQDAIRVGIKVGEILGVKNFRKIMYENSGDVTGDKSKVVGYASVVGYSDRLNYTLTSPDNSAKNEALNIARQSLYTYFHPEEKADLKAEYGYLGAPLGVFVTLTKNGQLRGCIGDFEPSEPLYKVIEATAVKSATRDKRFLPVTEDELKDIKIELSVMTPRKKARRWQDIRLGVDGVVIQKGVSGGTFLPQVATDNNWDLEKLLGELCVQKAGLNTDCYKDPSVDIYSYEVTRFAEE